MFKNVVVDFVDFLPSGRSLVPKFGFYEKFPPQNRLENTKYCYLLVLPTYFRDRIQIFDWFLDMFGYSPAIFGGNLAFRGCFAPPECQIILRNSRGASKNIQRSIKMLDTITKINRENQKITIFCVLQPVLGRKFLVESEFRDQGPPKC